MSEIREKVKEKLDGILANGIYGWRQEHEIIKDAVLEVILSIPELAIVDREAELHCSYDPRMSEIRLRKEGWVKEINER